MSFLIHQPGNLVSCLTQFFSLPPRCGSKTLSSFRCLASPSPTSNLHPLRLLLPSPLHPPSCLALFGYRMSSEASRLAQINRLKAKTAIRASAQARERGRSASPPAGGGKAQPNAQPGKESRNAAEKQKDGELLPLEPDKRLVS